MILMNRIIIHIVTKIEFPQMEYEGLPRALKRSVTLKSSEVEHFLSEAMEFINEFQKQVKKDLKEYLDKLLLVLKAIDISNIIFESYDKEIEKLKKEFEIKSEEIQKAIEYKKVNSNEISTIINKIEKEKIELQKEMNKII
jgi:hypothetical protein